MPGGQEQRRDLPDLREQLFRLLIHGDGVQIDDAVDALVVVLQADPILERTQIIADVEIARKVGRRRRLVVSC